MESTCPLVEQSPSLLDEARSLLEEVGPIQNYIITFTDPDEKINSILGLNKNNLELAEVIEDEGSMTLFGNIIENTQVMERRLSRPDQQELRRLLKDKEDLDTLYKNGFRISLGESHSWNRN
nr:hypothetical protein Cduv_195 [Cedratvirus duvanny]